MKQIYDMVGRKFYRLVVISAAPSDGSHRKWLCKCECGNEKIIYEHALCRGMTKSCGCYCREVARKRMSQGWANILTNDYLVDNHVNQKKSLRQIARDVGCSLGCVKRYTDKYNIPINDTFYDIIGKKFGRLTIESFSHTQKGMSYWNVKCECGTDKKVQGHSIVRNKIVSCGCWNREKCWKGCGDLSYTYWAIVIKGAIKRKLEFNITIEDAWNLFLKQDKKCALSGQEMQLDKQYGTRRRKKGLSPQTASLDRIDSDLGYVEGNVQWINVRINIMKSNMQQSEFIQICQNIAKHNRLNNKNPVKPGFCC